MEEVLCWQSYRQTHGVRSVPRYLEEHAERIRSHYLAFIHDLGEWRLAGKSIIDHLDLGDGFSFWWMTQAAEKSPFKSPRIYDCLRLICLEEMLLERRPDHLTLVSADTALARAMGRLCAHLRIVFSFEVKTARIRRSSARTLYEALPQPLRGLLSLRHAIVRWPLRRARPANWFSGDRALFICSYFIHLDPDRCARGQFHSRQWEDLPQVVREGGGRINWLQLFLISSVVPSVQRGVEWVRSFNANAPEQGSHAFLDSYLTFARALAAVALWLRLTRVAWRLRGVHAAFYAPGSSAWLWPLLRDDWQSSVSGPIAVGNCLAVVLFDAALGELPRQKMGLYLCENQAWEKALLRAWRRYGHGEIVGVQHATVPFWHLLYFEDRRSVTAAGTACLPLPDRLAVNGRAALESFLAAGFPSARLVEVEALRYLQLAAINQRAAAPPASAAGADAERRRKVLILGDIIPASMHHLLRLLDEAAEILPRGFELTLKPHPGYVPQLAEFPRLRVAQTSAALGEIARSHDVAVAANSTSAAVDVYVAGVPVIIALDGDSLNLSPLRGRPDVRFVSSAQELAGALRAPTSVLPSQQRADFFFMDAELPRWSRLLGYPQTP